MGGGLRISRSFSFSMIFIAGLMAVFSQGAWAQGDINGIRLKKEKLPAGWMLVIDYEVPEQQTGQFEKKFIAPIDRMINQVIKIDGKEELTINYVACPSERDAYFVYGRMVELAGFRNVIVRNGNIVIEIISDDDRLKDKTLSLLKLSELQMRKLKSSDVPDDWNLVKELFVFGAELDGFEKKLGAGLTEMINQYFLVKDQRVRINYISCAGEKDAAIAYEKLKEMVGKVNVVIRNGDLVIEIITDDEKLRRIAAEIVGKI